MTPVTKAQEGRLRVIVEQQVDYGRVEATGQ